MSHLLDIKYDSEKYKTQKFTHVSANEQNILAAVTETHIMVWVNGINELPIVKSLINDDILHKITHLHHINNTLWIETQRYIDVYDYGKSTYYFKRIKRIFEEKPILPLDHSQYITLFSRVSYKQTTKCAYLKLNDIGKTYIKELNISRIGSPEYITRTSNPNKILISSNGGIYLYDLLDGKYATFVYSSGWTTMGRISPNSQFVAYYSDNDSLSIVDINVHFTTKINIEWETYGFIDNVVWIYNGKQIIFSDMHEVNKLIIKVGTAKPKIALSTGELILLDNGMLKYIPLQRYSSLQKYKCLSKIFNVKNEEYLEDKQHLENNASIQRTEEDQATITVIKCFGEPPYREYYR